MRTDVARLTDLGFDCFPCWGVGHPKVKQPKTLGRDWRDGPPTTGWDWAHDDLIGVNLPLGTVVLDIDNLELFRASGLEPVMSVASGTLRAGGMHVYYRSDGRTPPQVTEGATIGYDSRVGGLGYVIAWEPERWTATSEWALAPEWLYAAPPAATGVPPRDPDAPMTTRLDILSFLGPLARAGKLGRADYYEILLGRRATGRIVATDPRRPWTDEDLRELAAEAAKWPAEPPQPVLLLGAERIPVKGMTAGTLMQLTLEPLQWRVGNLIPEGLGLLAAPPKSGKSVLAYQLAAELATGGSLLDISVPPSPVLYYALEDGQRRSQSRLSGMLRGRVNGLEQLHLQWDSPRLGGPLETEISAWLDRTPGALVIIDVLAKVRPVAGGRNLNAYDEDYNALSGLHMVAKAHPGSTILVITHDRKAGSEDWMTRVTGTRGVTGAADFVIFIHRDRGSEFGTISVSGRDVEDASFNVRFNVTGWTMADLNMRIGGESPVRQLIFHYVEANGPAYQRAIADGTFEGRTNRSATPDQWLETVKARVRNMAEDGQLVSVPGGYRVPGDAGD
jgi:hypothetical protein